MKKTALQKFDHLFDRLTIDELQNHIEDQGFILADRQELVDALRDINQNLVTRNQDLQTTKDSLQQDRDAAVARCTSLESDVWRLQQKIVEIETVQESKRNRLAELQAEHNAYIQESTGVINNPPSTRE
jgi:phage shock protein A